MIQNTLKLSMLALFLIAAPVACGEAPEEEHGENNHDHDHDHAHGDEEHVCVHFEAGPEADVNAIVDQAGAPPETFQEHTRIDVTVPDGEDTVYVQWTAEEAGEFVFWLSQDAGFVLIDAAGTEVAPEDEGGAAAGCETMAVAHKKFDVTEQAYTIRISGVTGGELQFAAEHAGEHGGHSE